MIATPRLRRRAVAMPSETPVAPMARQSTVSQRDQDARTLIIESPARSVDFGHYPRTIAPAYSEWQVIKGGPILNAIIRPWLWPGFRNHVGAPPGFGHSPIPIGPPTGSDKWSLAGGSIQAPRPRWTRVMRVPQYTTAPEEITAS